MKKIRGAIGLALLAIVLSSYTCGRARPDDAKDDREYYNLAESKHYQLGSYYLYPAEKLIFKEKVYRSPYVRYKAISRDSVVCYDSTTLAFWGENFDFREYVPYDLASLNVLAYCIDGYGTNGLFIDKNTSYPLAVSSTSESIPLQSMQNINGRFYKKATGELFFISTVDSRILWRLNTGNQSLAVESLKHIADDCFASSNGLYHFKKQYNIDVNKWEVVPVQLEQGAKSVAVYATCIAYGESVYLREVRASNTQEVRKIEMDGRQLKELYLSTDFNVCLVTDGRRLYTFPKIKNSKELEQLNSLRFTSLVQLTDDQQCFLLDEKNNTLYYRSKEVQQPKLKEHRGALFKINEQYYTINSSSYVMTPVNEVYIYTNEGKPEKLELDKYQYVGDDLYVYKKHLYGNLCTQVSNKVEAPEKLTQLKHNGVATRYFINQNALFFNSKVRNFTAADTSASYPPSVIRNVDFATLKVIGKELLVDKGCIYNQGNIIPVSHLGIKVKVYN